MKVNWSYVFGATTIALIVGGTAYAIYKARQSDKLEEEAISLEEAKDIVSKGRTEEKSTTTVVENPSDDQGVDTGFVFEKPLTSKEILEGRSILYDEEEELAMQELEEMDKEDKYPEVYESIEGPDIVPLTEYTSVDIDSDIDPKEDTTLRHDPNSLEARNQYIRMELAEWPIGVDEYNILLKLFEVKFIPKNDGDEMLRTQVIDHKVQFYGFNSRWVKEVSFADIIFHYARAASFNCGETVSYWVDYFLDFNEFVEDTNMEFMAHLVLQLSNHTYYNSEKGTYGLFGLSEEGMNQAIQTADLNIDRSVSFEIEFNEFLKSIF